MNTKHAWLIFLISLVIALPVRIYQQLMLVDEGTGFFTDGNITATIISVVLAVGSLVILIFCYRDKTRAEFYRPVKNLSAAIAAFLTAVALITEAISSIIMITSSKEEELVGDGISALSNSQHPLLYSILALLGVAAAIIIIITAVGILQGSNSLRSCPVATLVLPLWGCIGLIVMFVKFTEVVNTTENVYDLFSLVFLLLFLSSQSKLLSGIEQKKNGRTIFAYGLPAALVGIVTSVPNLIVLILGIDDSGKISLFSSLTTLMFSLYLLTFLLAVYSRKNCVKENLPVQNDHNMNGEPSIG